MKILVHPRDANPYQAEVYGCSEAQGDEVRYVGELTRSHSVNIALLPAELFWARVRGFRTLHLHWVHRFALPVISRLAVGRRAMRAWFTVMLCVARLLGIRIVWIAHNVRPHSPVFDDDDAACRSLLSVVDAVVVHDPAVLAQLSTIGRLPRQRHVVRHPGYDVTVPAQSSADREGPLNVLFFGAVLPYKGVPDLLRAAESVQSPIRLVIAGECRDEGLAAEVRQAAAKVPHDVTLTLRRLSEAELQSTVAAADVVVLPFTRVTTSGSLLYALSAGRPVILPDIPTLAGVPASAVVRYEAIGGEVSELCAAIDALATAPAFDLATRGAAAREWASSYTWRDLASDLARASIAPERAA